MGNVQAPTGYRLASLGIYHLAKADSEVTLCGRHAPRTPEIPLPGHICSRCVEIVWRKP